MKSKFWVPRILDRILGPFLGHFWAEFLVPPWSPRGFSLPVAGPRINYAQVSHDLHFRSPRGLPVDSPSPPVPNNGPTMAQQLNHEMSNK